MRITAEFVTSAARLDQLPTEQLPEIALTGRSNVGKSSLINTLVNKKGLAKTSNTPGRTQTLNYYRITIDGKPMFIVDMPGYGFASVSRRNREDWVDLIDEYSRKRPTLRGIIQLIDLRHTPQPLDYAMTEWLKENDLNYLIIGNKADKISRSKVPEQMLKIAEALNIDSLDTLPFSAETSFGKDKVWRWIIESVKDAIV